MGEDIGIILTTLEGSLIEQSFTFSFPASNNEAEYEAVLAGLRMAMILGVTGLKVQCDFSLVINQVSREYITRDARMAEYLQLVLALKLKSPYVTLNGSPDLKTITVTNLST